jgi:hypothetical protein
MEITRIGIIICHSIIPAQGENASDRHYYWNSPVPQKYYEIHTKLKTWIDSFL